MRERKYTILKAARPRFTRQIHSMQPLLRLLHFRTPTCATQRSKTGAGMSITSSRSAPTLTRTAPCLVMRKEGRSPPRGWFPMASIVPGDDLAVVGQLPDHGVARAFEALEQ